MWGLVFQYPEHQLFAETVREEIAYGCRNLGFAEGTMVAASRRALDAVGLDASYLSRSPFAFPVGKTPCGFGFSSGDGSSDPDSR